MRRLERILVMALSVVMIVTSTCVPSLAKAKTTDPYASLKKGTGYVAVGDSFTRGFGASDHYEDQIFENEHYGHYNCRNVDGSFPNYVAKAFGLKAPNDIRKKNGQLWPIAHDAFSTAYMLDLLGIDDGFRDNEVLYKFEAMRRRYSTDLKYFGDPNSFKMNLNKDGSIGKYGKTGEIMSIRKLLKNASLITIALGMSDILNRAMDVNIDRIESSDISHIPAEIKQLIKDLYAYFDYWEGAFPLLMDYLKDNCQNAKIVLIGAMNPVENVMITDEVLVPFGSAINIITNRMNRYIEKCAKEYGFIYVDINNVDTPSTDTKISIKKAIEMQNSDEEWGLVAHPTPAGYTQIGRLIVNAVKKELAKDAAEQQGQEYVPENPKTYITTDIGRHEKVDCVKIDGKKAEFTVKDHVLTVSCYRKTAKKMTVGVVKEDGTVTVMTYKLQYNEGYTARRTYVSNDLKGDVKAAINAPISLPKKAINLVKDLIN